MTVTKTFVICAKEIVILMRIVVEILFAIKEGRTIMSQVAREGQLIIQGWTTVCCLHVETMS